MRTGGGTSADGVPVIIEAGLSATEVMEFPPWEDTGQGQLGRFNCDKAARCLAWKEVLAQLVADDYNRLLATDIIRVAVVLSGAQEHWWAQGGADYNLVVWDRGQREVQLQGQGHRGVRGVGRGPRASGAKCARTERRTAQVGRED